MAKIFADFDMAGFWKPSEYALKEYVGALLTDEAVVAVEQAAPAIIGAILALLLREDDCAFFSWKKSDMRRLRLLVQLEAACA